MLDFSSKRKGKREAVFPMHVKVDLCPPLQPESPGAGHVHGAGEGKGWVEDVFELQVCMFTESVCAHLGR